MSELHNWKMLCLFTLRSPLSHIAERQSTETFLVEEPIRQPDGSVALVFSYAGNAWRGQLRDLMADYFLDHVGLPTIGLDAFQLLYSGGAIGGTQQTNLAQARAYRRLLTSIGLLGGGIGNQTLPGKVCVDNCYPVCLEAQLLLPDWPGKTFLLTSYRGMTFQKEFSRMDDRKDARLNHRLALPETVTMQPFMLGEPETSEKSAGGAATQMRVKDELLQPGVQLLGAISLLDASLEELGCLVSGLHRFSRKPYIGGQSSRGHGRVALETLLIDLDTGTILDPFVTVRDDCLLSPPATQAKDAYDRHLIDLYTALIERQEGEIHAMLGALAG